MAKRVATFYRSGVFHFKGGGEPGGFYRKQDKGHLKQALKGFGKAPILIRWRKK